MGLGIFQASPTVTDDGIINADSCFCQTILLRATLSTDYIFSVALLFGLCESIHGVHPQLRG